jgi:hypothetical protein
MKDLGIAVYPGHASLEDNKQYIKRAAQYGFTRIFTCLLSLEGHDKAQIVEEFKQTILYANSQGFQVLADVAPRVFTELKLSPTDLTFFADLYLYGIRLDVAYSGIEESLMTFNPHNLKIEINMSNDTHYLNTILDYKPCKDNLLGCHNFYPHIHTGLSREHYERCNARFMQHGIRTAAFVNAQSATFGPWPVDQGLCTLEEHRNLPIEVQAKELFLDNIDVVIIANCYASEAELAILSKLNRQVLELRVEIQPNVSAVERSIILDELHFNRGDVTLNMIRSTQSRVKHKGHNFVLFNPIDMQAGDVIIESSLYGHYAGELQIARTNMANMGKSSVVARVCADDLRFLPRIEAWQKFRLVAQENKA